MMRPTTIVLPIALMAFAIVSFLVLINYSVTTHLKKAGPISDAVACTEEAKLCPDGSTVGRTGPDCEFAPCPITNANRSVNLNTSVNTNLNTANINTDEIACAADVRSCSDGSYVQRIPPSCDFAACPSGTEQIPPDLP